MYPLIEDFRDETVRKKLVSRLKILYESYFVPPTKPEDLEPFTAGNLLNDDERDEAIKIGTQIVDEWEECPADIRDSEMNREDFIHAVVLPEFLAFAVMKNWDCSRGSADVVIEEAIAVSKLYIPTDPEERDKFMEARWNALA